MARSCKQVAYLRVQVLQGAWFDMASRPLFRVHYPVREAGGGQVSCARLGLEQHDESWFLKPYWLQAFRVREGAARSARSFLRHGSQDET